MSLSSPTKPQSSVQIPRSTSHPLSAQDPDLRSQINAQLLRDGHIDRIHNHLTHTLSSDPSNLPTRIRQHALHLLRSGDASCTTFPTLMARVLADVRADTAAARREDERRRGAEARGEMYEPVIEEGDERGRREGGSLEVPKRVVEEGVRVTRECLEAVVEVEP